MHLPLCSIIAKHGSPFIIGTVSGLTRIFLSIGQALGPFLASKMYSASQSSDSDVDRLLHFFLPCALLNIVVCLFGNAVVSLRPDFAGDVETAVPPYTKSDKADEEVFEVETGEFLTHPVARHFGILLFEQRVNSCAQYCV